MFRVKINMQEPVKVIHHGVITEFQHDGKVLPMWYLEQNLGFRVSSSEEDGKTLTVESEKWGNVTKNFPYIVWELKIFSLVESIKFYEVTTPSGHYRELFPDSMLSDYSVGPWN